MLNWCSGALIKKIRIRRAGRELRINKGVREPQIETTLGRNIRIELKTATACLTRRSQGEAHQIDDRLTIIVDDNIALVDLEQRQCDGTGQAVGKLLEVSFQANFC